MLSAIPDDYSAYVSALGLGLLIGIVRERQRDSQQKIAAGMRTHTLAALVGAVGWQLGLPVFAIALAAVALLAFGSYRLNPSSSPGLTGEVALVLTTLLGGLAQPEPGLAAALAVLVALLLQSRAALHRFSRELISEAEVRDGLLLLAAIVLVLPLLPNAAVGPYGVLNPAKLWQLVVLVMAISAAGHIALRVVGSRFGLPLAGFFAGFVSSTAAIAGFGQRLREQPALRRSCVAAAEAAALASLLLAIPVLGTVSTTYLSLVLPQLLAFGAVLALAVLLGLRGDGVDPEAAMPTAASRMFRLSHALVFAALIAGVLLLSAFLQERFGSAGALLTSAIAALIELHAAMASIAQLGGSGALNDTMAEWALQAVLLSSVLARAAVAFTAGGRAYGLRVGGVLALAWAASSVAVLL
ncbi:DUF4010 domain-containing protein [uncultured Aquimonas sp.]|uniref:MgtC/SapB family protein n=1 Tax=uncultured Aquimonas sp. TaxID=385483 RepID=UPI000869CEFA|nr:DUF4010 domain-containing protein [uncultured Aquimonas sp.]ODU44881.1 MAG: hypothetical protein ABS96_16000 [Xanthomonadaceae bacterium SCN 69-123]